MTENIDGEEIYKDGLNVEGVLAGYAANHAGHTASLTAPSGPQEKELIMSAVIQAGISPGDVDAVEAWAQAHILADAVETQAITETLRGSDVETPLAISTVKTNVGMGMEVDGLMAMIKVMSNCNL